MATCNDFGPSLAMLAGTDLFAGLGGEAIQSLLPCLQAAPKRYRAGECLLQAGDTVKSFGVVLSGSGRAFTEDLEGRQVLLARLEPGSEIGVILSASRGRKSPVTVQAQTDMAVLTIPFSAVLARCPRACESHERLLRNYLGIVAGKGLALHERIDCLLKPTVREKVLSYLNHLAGEQGGRRVLAPLNRASMAAYLNTDRSALSRELSRMRRAGLIDFHKNSFQIL